MERVCLQDNATGRQAGRQPFSINGAVRQVNNPRACASWPGMRVVVVMDDGMVIELSRASSRRSGCDGGWKRRTLVCKCAEARIDMSRRFHSGGMNEWAMDKEAAAGMGWNGGKSME